MSCQAVYRQLHAMLTTNSISVPISQEKQTPEGYGTDRVILDQEMACLLESEVHVLCIGHSVPLDLPDNTLHVQTLSMLSPILWMGKLRLRAQETQGRHQAGSWSSPFSVHIEVSYPYQDTSNSGVGCS